MKNKKFAGILVRKLIILILIFGVVFLVGAVFFYFWVIRSVYSPREEVIFWDHPLVDKSFITNQPCAAPCWYGLMINQSSYEDVEEVLEGLPFVEKNSLIIWVNSYGETDIHFDCPYEINNPCGLISLFDDKTISISTLVAYELTFEDIVERIGLPATVQYSRDPGSCSVTLNWTNLLIRAENISAYESSFCRELFDQGTGVVPYNLQVTYLEYLSRERFRKCGEDNYYCFSWVGFEDFDESAP